MSAECSVCGHELTGYGLTSSCEFCELTRERDEAREAARWLAEHRGEWDGPEIPPEVRWPWIKEGSSGFSYRDLCIELWECLSDDNYTHGKSFLKDYPWLATKTGETP